MEDNAATKMVRPSILVYLTLFVSILAVVDGNWIQIEDGYLEVFQALLVTVYGFYFTSRGLEKIAKIISDRA